MASYRWTTSASDEQILAAVSNQIKTAGFEIDTSGTTDQQISAFRSIDSVDGYWAIVKLIASWKCRRQKHISIELRSDEPHLRLGNNCEKSAIELLKLLPPVSDMA